MNLSSLMAHLDNGPITARLDHGGARQVTLTEAGNFYGPTIEIALEMANDLVVEAATPPATGGDTTADSPLDQWLLDGGTFGLVKEGDKVRANLHIQRDVQIPADLFEHCEETLVPQYWTSPDGYTFTIKMAGDSPMASILSSPEGGPPEDGWFTVETRTGLGPDIMSALINAFE